jgi:hypothetical protein
MINFPFSRTEPSLVSGVSNYSTAMRIDDLNHERTEMSSQDRSSDMAHQEGTGQSGDHDNEAVASKLSKELSNWRRRRTNGRPRRNDGERVNYQTESARTIKLRGHETLVVRKPKLSKPAISQRPNQ